MSQDDVDDRISAQDQTPTYDTPGTREAWESQSDFHLLKQALLNERIAPEIMQHKFELVERVRAALQNQESVIEELERQQDTELHRQVLSLERDRVRWLLKAYLRERLLKVQRLAADVLQNAEIRPRLSSQEWRFANDHFVALGRHLKSTLLDQLPDNYRGLVKQSGSDSSGVMIERPDTDVFVFCYALEDCGQIPDGDDGGSLDLAAGDFCIVNYRSVAPLVSSGQACLM